MDKRVEIGVVIVASVFIINSNVWVGDNGKYIVFNQQQTLLLSLIQSREC